MPPYRLTIDAPVKSPTEPGFHHRYDPEALLRSLNTVADGVSPQALWHDQFNTTIMLKPEQLNDSWLNNAGQLPYILRLSGFQTAPANLSSVHLFEANLAQNPNNPFIHHTPISPTVPTLWADSPEQAPGLINLDTVASDPGLVTGFPGALPGVAASDVKIICWTPDTLPWNLPLFLRWWVPAARVGHITIYDFYIGQFCLRCGPAVVEVFRDISTMHNRSAWKSIARTPLFLTGAGQDTTAEFSDINSHGRLTSEGALRELLWLPYRRNYVYLESSANSARCFKANPFAKTNGMSGTALDWGIVESRNFMVGALTPGPGFFQIQAVKFADGPGKFMLEPFVTDYIPSAAPAANWLFDDADAPQGATLTHSTPVTPPGYTFTPPDVDHCPDVVIDPLTDQTKSFGSIYTFTPGHQPDQPSLLSYTPMLYGVEARVPFEEINWPKTQLPLPDVSTGNTTWVKRVDFSVTVNEPGRMTGEVTDLTAAIAGNYFRSEFPLSWADTNGHPLDSTMWTTLWLGIAEPVETHERRLDTAAPRELRFVGTDFWKWLNETPVRDNRDWWGFGHIYVVQQLLQQCGLSIANWDGPAPGTVVQQPNATGQSVDRFVPDAMGLDDPLGGAPTDDPTLANGTSDATGSQPFRSPWRAAIQPPDTYGSFIKRIAELWSGWDYGFHSDGSFFYHRWDYYAASEVTFHKDHTNADPHYYRGSVQYEPIYPDANTVSAFASTFSGALIASSSYIDFPSVLKPTAVNFIGRNKGLYPSIPGILSCGALNKCARSIWERARRRRVHVRFKGTYVPMLKVGHCLTLEGITGLWRLQSVSASYERPNWNVAEMTAELVESGHS